MHHEKRDVAMIPRPPPAASGFRQSPTASGSPGTDAGDRRPGRSSSSPTSNLVGSQVISHQVVALAAVRHRTVPPTTPSRRSAQRIAPTNGSSFFGPAGSMRWTSSTPRHRRRVPWSPPPRGLCAPSCRDRASGARVDWRRRRHAIHGPRARSPRRRTLPGWRSCRTDRRGAIDPFHARDLFTEPGRKR